MLHFLHYFDLLHIGEIMSYLKKNETSMILMAKFQSGVNVLSYTFLARPWKPARRPSGAVLAPSKSFASRQANPKAINMEEGSVTG